MSVLDKMVRGVDVSEARDRYEQLWQEVNATLAANQEVRRTLYFDSLIHTSRLILDKLEEKEDIAPEVWESYCQLLGHCVLSYGTAEVPKLLRLFEGIGRAVLRFPSRPIGLLSDYQLRSTAQREQFVKCLEREQRKKQGNLSTSTSSNEGAATAAAPAAAAIVVRRPKTNASAQEQARAAAETPAPPSLQSLPKPPCPDIEHKSKLNAVAPLLPSAVLLQLLNELPTRMCLVHTNGILHLKLTNPLPIPQCNYVTTGYGCDTCKLQGLHVAYQAMLYEDDPADATSAGDADMGQSESQSGSSMGSGEVRSDAQITNKRFHGFDVCTVCAAYFFMVQKRNYTSCVLPPHNAYALGHASGVRIAKSTYTIGSYQPRPRPVRRTRPKKGVEGNEFRDPTAESSISPDRSAPDAFGLPRMPPPPANPPPSSRYTEGRSPSSQSVTPHGSPQRISPDTSSSYASASTSTKAPASPHPPFHPPQGRRSSATSTPAITGRRSSASSMSSIGSWQSAPLPPKTRARSSANSTRAVPVAPSLRDRYAKGTCSTVTLSVALAPFGARPIAWVLPSNRGGSVGEVEGWTTRSAVQYPTAAVVPPEEWRERCDIRSELAYSHTKNRKSKPRQDDGGGGDSDSLEAQHRRTLSLSVKSLGSTDIYPTSRSQRRSTGVPSLATSRGSAKPTTPRSQQNDAGGDIRSPVMANDEDDLGAPDALSATARPNAPSSRRLVLLLDAHDVDDMTSESGESHSAMTVPNRGRWGAADGTEADSTAAVNSVADVCTICLNPLAGELPVIETKCHHFFHVECIEGYVRMSEDLCPLCRRPSALPEMTRDSALARNVFHLTVHLSEEESRRESVTVCVGALVTRNGVFENIMSMAAGRCITVRRPDVEEPGQPVGLANAAPRVSRAVSSGAALAALAPFLHMGSDAVGGGS